MIIALIGKDKMYKTVMPDIVTGDYWINDENDKKIINVQKINGKCHVVSGEDATLVNPEYFSADKPVNATIKECDIDEYSIKYVAVKNHKELFILYCCPTCETFTKYDLTNPGEIIIGSDSRCHIQINNNTVKERHARIYYSNGQLMLDNYDEEYGTFINNRAVGNTSKLLFNGDVIFVMGTKIIIMGKSIFINNPLNTINLDSEKFKLNTNVQHVIEQPDEDDSDTEIYSDDDYFARSPRIMNIIEKEKVKIDSPPQMRSKEGMPLVYVLGSTLSMGAVSLISSFTTIQGLVEGRTTFKDALPSLLITFALLISTMLIPVLNMKYDKKQKAKYEKTRQKRYKEYINSKMNQIKDIMEKQRKILFENYVSTEECSTIIMTKNSRLWERKIEDDDFLSVRLGIGDVPLQIDIQYPEQQFTMEDDDLVEMLNELGNESKTLKNAPITVSFAKSNLSALVVRNNDRLIEKFMQSTILQLVTFQSYDDLKLVFLVDKEKKNRWERMKMLPHVWNSYKTIRFFADDYDDMKEISKYLEEDLKFRRENNDRDNDYRRYKPYYLIITDDYKSIRNLNIISEITKDKQNLGFSILCITDNLIDLPDECKTFITLDEDGGVMFESEMSSTNRIPFAFDSSYTFFFEKICKQISDIPIRENMEGNGALPNSYNFLEMYDVGRIEQLNTLEKWKTNDSTLSLAAPIGIDASGRRIILDIHEKFHGPHGLIAGSTGSGKSEFIITYILSLAVNYHPDDLSFLLIDYKGGGLAGAFEKKNVRLPHLVGTITNIETAQLQRSLASIKSELRRRQVIFNEARNTTDEGTIDIYKYQKLYHDGLVSKPVPHLLIICDEFAELKQQQEEFMDELISVARIGRSLGVHLILATQKPAGIVNDQIRSNSKFAICLKVQDREDSMDVIKRPDAAELKKVGQFYMQVGNNEYFTLGQSAWAGALYYPTDVVKKKIDNSIKFISNIGSIIKQVDPSKKEFVANDGEQLTNVVKYLDGLAKQEGIKPNNLWIENIPETIFVDDIRNKYKIKSDKNTIAPIIGEYDDPSNQRQGPVPLDLSNGGNTIIFGNADSGKETLLGTIMYDAMTNYSSEDIQFYAFDFGSEALKVFKDSPHVGDVVFSTDVEKTYRFFGMIQYEIKRRISILSDFGGNYKLYTESGNKDMPLTVVIINNYEAFSEMYENEFDDVLLTLTRDGVKCGVEFIITVSGFNDVRYRMAQNFKQKIALQLNNADDYLNIWDGIGKKKPANIFGRGLVKLDDIYEFQVAKICQTEEWNKHIQTAISKLKEQETTYAKPIPVMPEKIMVKDLKEHVKDLSSVPVGIERNSLNVFTFDFKKNFTSIITGKSIDAPAEYSLHIIEELRTLNDVNIVIFDVEGVLQTQRDTLINDYNNFRQTILNQINSDKQTVCVIIGVDRLINDIDPDFGTLLTTASRLENYNFILVDNFTRLKNHEYDPWYKDILTGDTGIWIGNGMQDQYLINYNIGGEKIENNCRNSFGYVILQSEPTMIKLVGMEEN